MSRQKRLTYQGQPASLRGLAIDHDIPYSTLVAKWRDAGKLTVITEDWLETVKLGKRRRSQARGKSTCKRMRERSLRTTKMYDDPGFLPHITKGDLAHLSDTENTGAARAGCEEWDRLNPCGIPDERRERCSF